MTVVRLTDEQLKESMLMRLTARDRELVDMIVEKHRRNSPHLLMRMAIWLNAKQLPWQSGVTILEICDNIAIDHNPDFHPIEFGPHEGWPRMRTILTHRVELNVDCELAGTAGETPFLVDLEKLLESQEAVIVFPPGAIVEDFKRIVAEPWNVPV